jgi:hypothetical protein
VLELPHSDSFDSNESESPKKAAHADAFALPTFLVMLLVFGEKRPACNPQGLHFKLAGGSAGNGGNSGKGQR